MTFKIDFDECDPNEVNRYVWRWIKEDLHLGISQDLRGVRPYVCAYLFGYNRPEKMLTDIEQARVKVSLRGLLAQEISDLAGDLEGADEDYAKHLRDSLGVLKDELDRASKKIGRILG